MKTSSVLLWALASFMFTTVYSAEKSMDRFYLGVDAGGNLMSKVQHPHTPLTLSMEPGARFDVQIGYNFFRHDMIEWGAELDFGVAYNGISHGTLSGTPTAVSGYLMQVPVIVNSMVRFFPESHWVPYFGFGAGGVKSTLSFSWFDSADDITPATQISGGLVYSADDLLSVGFDYKCLMVYPDKLRQVTNHSILLVFGFNF